MNTTNGGTVLVTGASKGIGREIAREFARRGYDLAIVAHDPVELEAAAAEFRRDHGVDVRCFARDLAQADEIVALHEELGELPIEILCNNAGLGQRGRFWEIPLERDLEILHVNVEAVLRLTKLFLPPMLERGHGRILNTASIAGFEPGPLLAVYHASKAFVLSLTEALATELEATNITVTALCPGPVDTDFFTKADMIDTKVFQKGNVMGPREVAAAAVEAALNGERIVVPGAMNKAMVAARRVTPIGGQAKLNEKYYEDAGLDQRKRERGDVEREEAADAAAEHAHSTGHRSER